MTAYTQSKKFLKTGHDRGLIILSILLLCVVVFVAVLYLIQTNSLVSCSYQIMQEEEHLDRLQTEHHNLKMEIAQWQSPANLEEVVRPLGMVEVKKIIYLEEDKAVAMKK